MAKFRISEEEVKMWLNDQVLTYASSSAGRDGKPVRLRYRLCDKRWVVDRGDGDQLLFGLSETQEAVDAFNDLV